MENIAFMKCYTSLMNKTNNSDLSLVLQFCNYFRSDDLNLFEEYKNVCEKGISTIDLIKLYAKRYNLDVGRDIKEIMHLFVKNTIQEGYVYHLGNSVNSNSIMQKGMCLASRGMKTEEEKDFELLSSSIDRDILCKLTPFYKSQESGRVFYSTMPILNARYGDRPEWLLELKRNLVDVEEELKKNPEAYYLVTGIIEKYDKKYNGSTKELFIIPNPMQLPDEKLASFEGVMPADNIIGYLYSNALNQKDMSTTNYIAPDSIMSVNLDTYKISYSKDGEIIEYSDSDKSIVNNI